MNILFKFISFTNVVFIFLLLYLGYHMIFGKYNLGNFLINDFQQKLLDDAVSNLKKEITSIDKDLKALYSNYDDFIDEVEKKKFGNTSHGEALIKLN